MVEKTNVLGKIKNHNQMKKINYLLLIIFSISIIGCESNDPLKDISTLGLQAPNIYFVPIEPLADPDSEIPIEIEYWTVGNEIASQSLWDRIYLTEEFDISIKDVQYTYKNTLDTLLRDKEIYKQYDFDFTDWTPDKKAYVFKTNYFVDGNYAKKTFTQTDTDKDTFASLISDKALDKIHASLLNNKTLLKSILVDNNLIVNLDEFNNWYDAKGSLTTTGFQDAKNALSSINTVDLIGDKYKKTETYKIYLNFRITNGNGEENESSSRSFKVKA